MNKILVTSGQGHFFESTYIRPAMKENEILVKSIMTGVCRSDIDMMQGNFGPLPIEMQGHEGLGKVIQIGEYVNNVNIGDYVATRGEPAYADFYYAKPNEYVVVPESHPRYILEPVACGINLIYQSYDEFKKRNNNKSRVLIIGSGFLAYVAYHTLTISFDFNIDVVGKSNKDIWDGKLINEPNGKYDIIIDLSSTTDVFDKDILCENSLIVLGSQKKVTTDFANLLWKSCTMTFPSPRNNKFIQCMINARNWIESGDLNIDKFWTKSYNRNTEWQQAFSDGLNRPIGYSRGYIRWD